MAGDPKSEESTGTGGENRVPADKAQLLELLNCGEIHEEHGMLRWSSNYTFLISVSNQWGSIKTVYKPQRGERPLWDFPDGTLCYRETASYIVSDYLGWEIVPPTVLRDGPRGIGSFQLYIPHDPNVNYFSLDETDAPQLMRIAAFDYMVNNADRKGGHILQDDARHLWGIDHGIAFNAVPKLRTVIWDFAGMPIPDSMLNDLARLCTDLEKPHSQLRIQLDKLIADAEVSAFQARVRRILQRREFPRPGPGPNYPWPPV